MQPRTAIDGPGVETDGVSFVLADRYRRLAGVRLVQELGLGDVAFTRDRYEWRLQLPRPPVDRIEYLFEIEHRNGDRATITDPANSLRATGAFGDKSVLQIPGYQEPAWLDGPDLDTDEQPIDIDAPLLEGTVSATLWSPRSLSGAAAPLLVVHDGPEYADLGGLTRFLKASIAGGALPPVRALLLAPGERDSWYSADPAYAETLVRRVVPAVDEIAASTLRIGIGVSLGALGMLHAHRSYPGTFAGLFLQSGSFFTPDLDAQESGFSGFDRVTAFVASVHDAREDDDPVRTVMTCGLAEENLANNRRMAASLRRLGYPTRPRVVRDAHNYIAWRDALHPNLTELITSLVARDAS